MQNIDKEMNSYIVQTKNKEKKYNIVYQCVRTNAFKTDFNIL